MSQYFGHHQTDKFLESFKVMLPRNPPPHIFPERLRVGVPLKKRRYKAFRVSETYAFDALRGYQLNEDRFNIVRIKPGLIPIDAQIIWMAFDHTRHDCYVCVEHESFPEYTPGKPCEEIPITLEEIEVMRPLSGPLKVDEGSKNEALCIPGRPLTQLDANKINAAWEENKEKIYAWKSSQLNEIKDKLLENALDEVERLKEGNAQLLFRLKQIREEAGRDGDPETKLFTISTVARCGEIGYIGKGILPRGSLIAEPPSREVKPQEPFLCDLKKPFDPTTSINACVILERQKARKK